MAKQEKKKDAKDGVIVVPSSSPGLCSCRNGQKGKIVPLQAAQSLTHNLSVLVYSGWMTEVEASHANA